MKNVIKVYLACGVVMSAVEMILAIKNGIYSRLSCESGKSVALLSGVLAFLIWIVAGPVHLATTIIKK